MNSAFVRGIYIVILIGLPSVSAEVKSASACYSSGVLDCDFMTLECNPGSRIRLLSMRYGAKDYRCNSSRNRCLNTDRDGCCAYDASDCTEYYNQLHAYNLHRACSGKQTCPNLRVPNKVLYSCSGSPVSTYVYVEYECVPDNTFLNFCELGKFNSTSISLLYDKTSDALQGPKNCSCFIKSSTQLFVDLVDIRLMKSLTDGPGSACPSTSFIIDPHVSTRCDVTINEENNFIHGVTQVFNDSPIEAKLLGLYKQGAQDSPEYVWITVAAKAQTPVEAVCFRHVDSTTFAPSSTTTSRSTTASNTTDIHKSGEAESTVNAGAIVAGVLVPVLLIVVAVIFYLVIKRRRHWVKKRPDSTPNSYVENSVENNEYAEIGFVPDTPVTGGTYDPVYEPKRKISGNKTDSASGNGHTYYNTGGETKENKKGPLRMITTHTNRLISFFKRQTERDFPPVQNRENDVSAGSYDHLQPDAAPVNLNKKLEISGPIHSYAHTTDNIANEQKGNKLNDKNSENKNNQSPQSGQVPHNLSAVDVGDAYIEFQVCDENAPNVIKFRDMDSIPTERPAIPHRPPPSPRAVAKLNMAQNSPMKDATKDTRSKSPNLLSPHTHSTDFKPSYDYAVEPCHSRSASNASHSDVSSEHSYKILEPQQPVYDYADVSDVGENEIEKHGSVYEDVEKGNKDKKSGRKHHSATEAQYSSDGYLAPITTRARAASNPVEQGNSIPETPKTTVETTEGNPLKKEMEKKFNQKKKVNDLSLAERNIVNEDKSVIKGGSNERNTTEKKTKAVHNMTKMFDNKETGVELSKNTSHENINRTCSDA